jgi:chromosome segregation ATPase
MRVKIYLLPLVIASLLLPAIAQQKSKCAELLKAVAEAQGEYNRAAAAWKRATIELGQAETSVKNINAKLKANFSKLTKAEAALDAARDDQAECEKAEKDNLAPLHIDCSKVPGRVQKAEKDVADAKATEAKLEADLKNAEAEVEAREEANAAAHAAERQAWAKLEAAKKAAAGCRTAA